MKLKLFVLLLPCFAFTITCIAQPKPTMIKVKGGTFTMGNSSTYADSSEKPHRVTVSSFSIGKYEVTVRAYKAFCKSTGYALPEEPCWGFNSKQPMVNVNFDDANAYCRWLSKKTGRNYRLPTEAEWEFAARGGNLSEGFSYAGGNEYDETSWNKGNSNGQPQKIGSKIPNELGIYDMSGNVWEWCSDWYGISYYNNSTAENPIGPSSGAQRVMRGGSWFNVALACKVDHRASDIPQRRGSDNGFRVVVAD